ncbi:hypothetical protein [Allorhizobium sonneratiae]|uniref:hypothetical protein n=1 Tax=Allorhizobium sonneratiae TaxID=2934936 RepID=UPI0020339ADB|nr:hypothetical protein [Allorhizobium sonneratiae]
MSGITQRMSGKKVQPAAMIFCPFRQENKQSQRGSKDVIAALSHQQGAMAKAPVFLLPNHCVNRKQFRILYREYKVLQHLI